ncbi:MAG: hypothetical protein J2P17_30230, partial [Mycobacterium sp.]|nr:hypothetical protein [Mycobacterium sp.]
ISLGVDDLNPSQLSLIPRLPLTFSGATISNWPARTNSNGTSTLVHIGYDLRYSDDRNHLTLDLTSDQPVDHWRIRLGPFPATARAIHMTADGAAQSVPLTASGDATWAWTDLTKPDVQHHITASVSQ